MQISRSATLIVLACFAAAILVPLELTRRATQAQEPEAQDPQAAEPDGGLTAPPPLEDSPPVDPSPANEPAQLPELAHPPRIREAEVAGPADGDSDPMTSDWPIRISRGLLSPGQSLTVAAQQEGVLETLAVREGDQVKKGATLASFPQDRLRIAELEVQVASKTLEQAESTYSRAKELGQTGGIPSVELERIRFDFEKAALHFQRARAEFDLLEQALVVRAPIDGIVTRLHHAAGESVRAGDPVVQLVNTQQMQVEGFVDLRRFWDVRPGAPVEVRIDISNVDLPVERRVFSGEITFVDTGVHQITQQVKVRARVENHGGLLKAGLPVQMTIQRPRDQDQNPNSEDKSDR